jgi:hypothetical protein
MNPLFEVDVILGDAFMRKKTVSCIMEVIAS